MYMCVYTLPFIRLEDQCNLRLVSLHWSLFKEYIRSTTFDFFLQSQIAVTELAVFASNTVAVFLLSVKMLKIWSAVL